MKLENVKDIYPLSPTQQTMLFQTLYTPGTDENMMQMVCAIRGDLNVAAFEDAWQKVVERHPALSTAFAWEGLDEPLQIVRKKVRLPRERMDWRGLPADEQAERLRDFMRDDRKRGFKISAAPLMRCTLIQIADDEYKFIWSFHHLLLDGWCLGLIIKEVALFYEASCRGEELKLEPTRPYRDYIAWLQKRPDQSKAEAFWRRNLKGFASPTHLMIDENIAETVDPWSQYVRKLTLSEKATESLLALARSFQMTLYNLVQGAWALLISQYSGESDVVFGVTVSGRPVEIAGVQSMIGLFINTLPVRAQISPEMSLAEWLKKLKNEQVEMYEHQYSSPSQIQKWSELPVNVPLFETVLIFENFVAEDMAGQVIGGAQFVESHAVEKITVPLAVSVLLSTRLSLQIAYHPERFSAAAIDRLLTQLQTLLEGMAANPEQRVSDLTMLRETERRNLVVELNDTRADYPGDTTLVRLFEEQVEQTPDAVALMDEHEQLTYRELNRRANQMGHYLRALGVGPETLVGICTDRSAKMLVYVLGILKAGGAYVPLDPQYPQERLAYMMSDTGVRLLVSEEHLVDVLPAHDARVIFPGSRDREDIARQSEHAPDNLSLPDNLVYIIYTSGSTGKPKGVQISQRSLINLLYAMRRAPGINERDIFLSVTTLSFDIHALEIFLPLIVGARVVVADRETARDGELLAARLASSGATAMQATPTTWRLLLDAGWQGAEGVKVLSGGEVLPTDLTRRLIDGGAVVWNLYGPTETAIWSTIHHVACEADAGSIGRPIANTQIYILDPDMELVAGGVPGELYIGGDGVSRGYLRRADLTAQQFVPDPFGGKAGARLYRTGDRARYLPDGNLQFLGRLDQQMKIRGHRIEPGEIEAAMAEHEGVRECVVAAHTDGSGTQRLVGYVVPRVKRTPALQPVRAAKERLMAAYQYSRLPNGLLFLGHSAFQTGGLYKEIYEDETYFQHGIRLADGDCVFDVGANIGMFSLSIKDRWRNARVFAFEPLPRNFELLRANVALYNLDVQVYECGLSARPGTATFTYFPNAPALSGLAAAGAGGDRELTRSGVRNWLQTVAPGADESLLPSEELDEMVDKYLTSETHTCELRTLSEVIRENNLDRIDLLKVDVEKSELEVLAGIEEDDWEKIRQIVMEVHSTELYEQVAPLLEKRGFHFAVERTFGEPGLGPQAADVYMLYARREEAGAHTSDNQGDEAHDQLATARPQNPPLSIKDLHRFLSARLPDYMVPSSFVELDALPLTPSGKINRRALPAPEYSGLEGEREYIKPRTHVEEVVAGAYSKVLGIEQVGAGDNFFELGGHSLLATQVVSRLREVLQVGVTLRDIFEAPVVSALSEVIEAATNGAQNLGGAHSERPAEVSTG